MFLMALALTALQAPPAPEATEPPPRPMEVQVVRDAITDQLRAYAIQRDRRSRLVISCEPADYDGARVTFHSERWLARGNMLTGERPVIYRFDQGRARRMMWDVNDRRGTLTSHSKVRTFLRQLVTAQKLVIRARDSENRLFDITFRLTDTRPAVEQVLRTCIAEQRAS